MTARPARPRPRVVGATVGLLLALVAAAVVLTLAALDTREWVADPGDPLSYRVEGTTCAPEDGGGERCRIEVSLRNDGDDLVVVRPRMAAAVVDGSPSGETTAPGGLPTGLEPDRVQTLQVEVVLTAGQRLEAVALDATDARSDGSTVVALR